MFFIGSETRARHRFIEQSIEGANDTLRNPHVVSRLGEYASKLAAVAPRLYIPNVRWGRLTIPAAYEETDMVPVVALKPDQTVRVSNDFNVFSPRQHEHAVRIVTGWQPTKDMPKQLVAGMAGLARGTHQHSDNRTNLGEDSLATVAYRSVNLTIEGKHFMNAPESAKYMIKSRPFVMMCYTNGHPLPPAMILHEYEHIDQHEREPIVAAANDAQELSVHRSYELEAYHVGAMSILGLRDGGAKVRDLADQVEIDAIRMGINGPGSFEYNDAIEVGLAAADIPYLSDY